MASSPDFVQFIADQCAGAGSIDERKMTGDDTEEKARTVRLVKKRLLKV